MIFKVAGASSILRFRLTVAVAASLPKTVVGELIVVREVEIVLDQGRTSIGVITDAISANPWVQERKCQTINDEQGYFEPALLTLDWHI
jgi:hypothetical protein